MSHISACRAKAWAAVVSPGGLPGRLSPGHGYLGSRPGSGVLCAAAVGVQLAQVVGGGGEQPFAAAGAEAAPGHDGHLLAGFDLPEHWFNGLGAELVAGAAAVVAHPPDGPRGGWQLGQVAAPSGVADAVGRRVFAQRREQPQCCSSARVKLSSVT